jgi:hypothetical protein
MACVIAKRSNDEKAARMDGYIGVACCKGIVATGDGTKRRPYLVTRISDEYDVVRYLGKQPARQALTGIGDRHFDVITCTDGSEIWFDITAPYSKFEEKLDAAGGRCR